MRKLSLFLIVLLLNSGCLNTTFKSYVRVQEGAEKGYVKFIRAKLQKGDQLYYLPQIRIKKNDKYEILNFLGTDQSIYGWMEIALPPGIHSFQIVIGKSQKNIIVPIQADMITPVSIKMQELSSARQGMMIKKSFTIKTKLYKPISIAEDKISFSEKNYLSNIEKAEELKCPLCNKVPTNNEYYKVSDQIIRSNCLFKNN